MPSARKAALSLLDRIDREGGYSNIVLDAFLKKEKISKRDASFVTALIYGVTERAVSLDYFLSHYAGRDAAKMQVTLRNILRLGAYQLIYMEKIPPSAAVNESVLLARQSRLGYASGFVNAVLRRVAENCGSLPYPEKSADPAAYLSVRYACPRPLIEKWEREYGRDTAEGIVKSLEERPPAVARVNTLKITPEALCRRLEAEGVKTRIEPDFSDSLILEHIPSLENLESFKEGLFILQDFASQLCCEAVDPHPGENILDLCAAPGGKTFTLAFRMGGKGKITSCDLYESRVGLIREGAQRLGLEHMVMAAVNDASHPSESLGLFDRVLCDVPCSGYGVIRRKPEIRYKKPETFDLLPDLQYSILCEGARHVKPGGRLVYSTCTLSRAENEEVAGRFLKENSGFLSQSLPERFRAGGAPMTTLFPHLNGTDGFFIACFQKGQPL